tara:strand:- start:788 stop:2506 length:1719 start_codon:yes stop_codon:yes gene_type:complete
MANAALKEEELVIPAGGIADFYLDDDEFEAMNRADAKREFGGAGIANFQDVASRMASYGRYGDDKLVHAETGELIVPKALIEDNPELRDSIFDHLRDMGIEDPERYVVGSDANSINPDTGLPEFFLKKIFKKVTKTVKKVVKKVKKVIKKVAPVVLPIVGSMFMGPIYGAALGSGIATLINGGSIKDAFKSALISGGTGALFSGVSGAISGEGFMSGISNAANPANLTEGFSNIGKAFTGDFSGASFANMKGGPASEGGTSYKALSEGAQLSAPEVQTFDVAGGSSGLPSTATQPGTIVTSDTGQTFTYNAQGQLVPTTTAGAQEAVLAKVKAGSFDMNTLKMPPGYTETPGVMDSLKDAFNFGEGRSFTESMGDIFLPSGAPTPTELMSANKGMTLDVAKQVAADMAPGLLRTFGPAAAAGTALAAGAGFFTAPEQEELDMSQYTGPTGEDLIAADPEKYRISDLEVRGSQGPTEVASPYTIVPGQGTFVNPFVRPQYAAEGGEIFPRRVGGIMPDEGVPGKDSVRAMLMPGEFVMTTDAVRGLGNGSMRQGINNMYDMMRGLEARGKAMA